MPKPDQRVVRTRQLLQDALMELIREHGYDATTVQNILDRSGVGRTTFYLHYESKDELFMSCHETIIHNFRLSTFVPLSREALFAPHASPEMVAAFQHLEEARVLLYTIFLGKENQLLLWQMRERNAQEIESNLRANFDEAESSIPLNLLANYLAGAHFSLVQWWLRTCQPCTPHDLSQTLHRLQCGAIRNAFGIQEETYKPSSGSSDNEIVNDGQQHRSH